MFYLNDIDYWNVQSSKGKFREMFPIYILGLVTLFNTLQLGLNFLTG